MLLEGIRNLLVFLLILGGIIVVHELGHLLVALRLGVKVDEFGIGLPPRAVKLFTWRGVDFTLNWLPIGGFVRPAGEDDPNVEGGLASSSPWVRLAVLAAGSVFNFVAGYLIFTLTFMTGWPTPERVVISYVEPGTPADVAGFVAGDVVLAVGGTLVDDSAVLAEVIQANLGEPLAFVVERDGAEVALTGTPRTEWPEDQGALGVGLTFDLVQYSLPQALLAAGDQVVFIVRETLLLPVRLIQGAATPEEARVVSPVGMKAISDQAVAAAVNRNAWYPVLNLAALISVALGLTNLLPLPALDGGRIMFVLAEMIRGRPIDAERERYVHAIGMIMLLSLMVVLVIQDLVNPIF